MARKLTEEQVQKLIIILETALKRITDKAEEADRYSHSVALGMAESHIEITIKQLKGEYLI